MKQAGGGDSSLSPLLCYVPSTGTLASHPSSLCPQQVHQTLTTNGLRERVALRADGGMRSGRDILVTAALGADEYGFGTVVSWSWEFLSGMTSAFEMVWPSAASLRCIKNGPGYHPTHPPHPPQSCAPPPARP